MNMPRVFLACAVSIVSAAFSTTVYGRGETPPPPVFSSGNVGSWLGSGPIFGFEDGGGSGGGWGGEWFEGGEWGGWGSGAGGSGAGGSGGYRGPRGNRGEGGGNLWSGDGSNPFFGTCHRMRETGEKNECSCYVTIQYTFDGIPYPASFKCEFDGRTDSFRCINVGEDCPPLN